MIAEPQVEILQAIADSGETELEDRWGASGNRVWVIDGASGLTDSILGLKETSDAAWLAELISDLLHSTAAETLSSSIDLVCESVTHRFRDLVDHSSHQRDALPTASFLVVELAADGWRWIGAGDCTAFDERGCAVPADPRLTRLDETVLDLIRSGRSPEDSMVRELLRSNRRRANRDGGYPVLGPGCIPGEFRSGTIPVVDDGLLLLTTDGFSRLVDTFDLFSADALTRIARLWGLDTLVDELRSTEAALSDNIGPAVFKVHDDATSVLIRAKNPS